MAINPTTGGLPAAVVNILEQKGFLQRLIRKSILPTLVFRPRKVAAEDYFEARIGETKTFTSRALIAPNTVPLNPASNTGLDNGMTADTRSFEQWVATLNEWPGFIPRNILGSEALLGDLYLDDMEALSQKAGSSLDLICSGRLFQAYDSGDTFATAASTGAAITVDNINGFDTQYPAANLPSYTAPQPVSTTNKVAIAIVDKTTLLVKAVVNGQAAAPDGTNVSYMQSGGQVFGRSGVLTADASATVAVGDRIVAIDPGVTAPTVGQALNPVIKDGSYVVRPLDTGGNMKTTAKAMLVTDVMNPSVMIPYAVAVAKRRGVPKLSNGLYGCAIDSTLLASFYGDVGFQRATATNWDRGRYFADGIIAAGWGVEFTEATQVPNYTAPAGGFQLRHAFVFGEDVIAEHPFKGAKDAADLIASIGDIADERWVDRIKFRTLAAIDTLGQVLKMSYDYVGDFQCRTDKSSNPLIVLSSDYNRFKRGVALQAASPF